MLNLQHLPIERKRLLIAVLVPLIGGRWYTWYIANWVIIYITSHLLREPGNSIDFGEGQMLKETHGFFFTLGFRPFKCMKRWYLQCLMVSNQTFFSAMRFCSLKQSHNDISPFVWHGELWSRFLILIHPKLPSLKLTVRTWKLVVGSDDPFLSEKKKHHPICLSFSLNPDVLLVYTLQD